MGEDDSKKQKSRGSNSNNANNEAKENDENEGSLISYRVPCSKGDVFRSKLLSPVDKRRLMKFLQLISDYGMTKEGSSPPNTESTEEEGDATFSSDAQTDPTTIESTSADATTKSMSENAMYSINERHLNKGRALSRPQNKAKPSSTEMESLIRCIRDNVDFSDFLTDVAKLPPRLCSVVTLWHWLRLGIQVTLNQTRANRFIDTQQKLV
jgi:hypothetical protein